MADKHPYVTSPGHLVQVLDQLRKSFPLKLNADVLKKLAIAPGNEGYAINVIRFLGLIDDQNARTDKASQVFTLHDQETFQTEFADVVKNAYAELFSLHGDDAWVLEQPKLITFFRRTDQSTERVGQEQARTFRTLAGYAGHGEPPSQPGARPASRTERPRIARRSRASQRITKDEKSDSQSVEVPKHPKYLDGNWGLTVRIEINLPVADDQETYDRIFRSIRENLLNE